MATSIGYCGGAPSYDDDIDTVPYVERLLVSPSWRRDWQANSPELPIEAAAHADVQWALRRAVYGREVEALETFCTQHERDDAMLSTQQRAA